ncbi:endo-1,3-alpha-glucanase family glycosylhydrolase [Nonomuraea sp. NBC_01738]|uniref:endo-1,3-alpha-glucanase family glycosylhydrolase n=1 Tax=Nonomuraea sp. NBC_01738 TaxID=2976003 RepID=UPI002E105BA0|nr:endo-1,3-alpha-glucanase family glycosylhydrolase [Nonomuraea sp. NBC_01738]
MRLRLRAIGLLLATLAGAVAMAPPASAAAKTVVFAASEDSYVTQAGPGKPHDNVTWLSACTALCDGAANSERTAYVRFTVKDLPANAVNVTMTLDVQSVRTTDTTLKVHPVQGEWSAPELTWDNRPSLGPAIATRQGLTAGGTAKLDVSTAFDGNGAYDFAISSAAGAHGVLHSSRATSGVGPKLSITYDTEAVSAGPLPFDLPSAATLRGSKRKVFAHYFTPYPISLNNKAGADDYYAKNYLNPAGEAGKHQAYGGLLRDRPIPRGVLSGDWQLADMKKEVQTAAAAGLDGFTVDILSLTSAHWDRLQILIKAAAAVDPGFKIVLMPDMTSLTADAVTLADNMAKLAASSSVYRLDDKRLVISPFKAEQQNVAWWQTFMKTMKDKHGITVAFVPVFLNFGANAAAFAPISYGFSNWGNRSPAGQSGVEANITKAHGLGKIWMQPVSVQDERPNQGIYDEAANTENLRSTWQKSITGGADWVQLTTWNDFSEGTQFVPSVHNGGVYLDLTSYYLTWWKMGKAPAIVRDTLYLTHRTQLNAARPTSGTQTKFMVPRGGTTTPRDTVEVLSFLTGDTTVKATIGGSEHPYAAKAGVTAKTFPLAYGVNKASAGAVTVSSPWTVTKDFAVQDLQYHAAGSGRK